MSNMRAPESIDLGQILGLQGKEVPMYNEPGVAAELRAALEKLPWFTHNASAWGQSVFIRFRGDDLFVAANIPVNPDIADPTVPQE